ncbi:hypothetical protein CONPUDRAFT_159637 [Coniophora puteana RWD-64-598 SS2]|uniref:Uncharacterized protein n=1 Tax=Coniophora puteana (strain RWD-64-598) TaxID=741705 RepID=A0A5M3M7N9_CONPW|nr:uncharacterized protein CONPUDRAFT_159637 [Coniophora puteana RWD-64-598 SS2]EIW74864.1 hypothetical protein CONPUDRAFT_159637 [Coniophora puteana RWD-64-598 SS2]
MDPLANMLSGIVLRENTCSDNEQIAESRPYNLPDKLCGQPTPEVLAITVGFIRDGRGEFAWDLFSRFMYVICGEPTGYPENLPPVDSFPLLTVWHPSHLPGGSKVHFYIGSNDVQASTVRLAAAMFLFTREHLHLALPEPEGTLASNTDSMFNNGMNNLINAIHVTYNGDHFMTGTIFCSDRLKTWEEGLLSPRQQHQSPSAFRYEGNGVLCNEAFLRYATYTTDIYVQETVQSAWSYFVERIAGEGAS